MTGWMCGKDEQGKFKTGRNLVNSMVTFSAPVYSLSNIKYFVVQSRNGLSNATTPCGQSQTPTASDCFMSLQARRDGEDVSKLRVSLTTRRSVVAGSPSPESAKDHAVSWYREYYRVYQGHVLIRIWRRNPKPSLYTLIDFIREAFGYADERGILCDFTLHTITSLIVAYASPFTASIQQWKLQKEKGKLPHPLPESVVGLGGQGS
ncbi:predicted protein [Plenodomus lingam JN3]|uniref:Predicted protein n=1 Tax=Leptosphaeria maculans (strain JN3 / isolate v23.1.3 / race Av1-4-5-6-7-8) TaxID=985895 RepID=E5A3T7_LEPMJ|nr:predicted protein [Plenodomus lingam JN3]CBX98300.1 predicted protein [Plenodomus lingam JN3]